MVKALVLVADGSEDVETVISCDILERAGIHVTRASVGSSQGAAVRCALGTKLLPDTTIEEAVAHLSDYAVLVLPGGSQGSNTFTASHLVQSALKTFAASESSYIAAICAAPMAVRQAEVFPGAKVTCYPGLEAEVIRGGFYKHEAGLDTVIDGRLITSRGPGTAFDFALNIVQVLKGKEARDKVASGILLP